MFFCAEGVFCLNKTAISLGSVTYAMRAHKLLSGIKIHSKLVKLDAGKSADGCIYGIIISSANYPDAVMELKKEGIPFSLFSKAK